MAKVVLIAAVLLGGCASTPKYCKDMSGEALKQCRKMVADHRDAVDADNWMRCNSVRGIRLHIDHSSQDLGLEKRGKIPGRWAIKADLINNNCKVVLRDYYRPYDF